MRRFIVCLCVVFALSSRWQSADAGEPTPLEQQMVEMINRMRANPVAELDILTNIIPGAPATWAAPKSDDADVASALSQFMVNADALRTQFLALTPAPPLAWNGFLGQSATTHSNLMVANNQQSHQFAGEPNLQGRITAGGYTLNGGWGIAENIYAFSTSVFFGHAGFAVDWGSGVGSPNGIQNPPGHRNAIMNANYRELGIGIVPESNAATQVGPLVMTQHFAYDTLDGPFLTGVAFNDLDTDAFYDPGEGLGGVIITARRRSNGQTYTTSTWSAGGYSLIVPANATYDITAVGGGLGARSYPNVVVGGTNVKLDLTPGIACGAIAGDINCDGLVTDDDYLIWRSNYGLFTGSATLAQGDLNGDRRISAADYAIWADHFTPSAGGLAPAVPEPATVASLTLGLALAGVSHLVRRTKRPRRSPAG